MKYRKYPYLKKQENGYYYAHFRDANGILHRRSLRTKSELQAMALFTKILREVDRGVLGFHRTPQRLPLARVAQEYLAEGTAELSPQTIRRHESALRIHVLPFFKRAPLAAVTPKRVTHYIRNRQRQGAPPNTLHKELAALSAVFNYAAAEELVHANPVLAVKKPKARTVKERYVPTSEELQEILKHLHAAARRFFIALCLTGCRLSEVAGTRVGDVDWSRGMMKVTRKGGRVDLVIITRELQQVIAEELGSREFEMGDPLFVNSRGNPYTTIRKPLETACRNAKLPIVTHHALRHAYATFMHERGVPLEKLSKLLGHASTQVTEKVYVHWKHEELKEAAEEICEIFANTPKQTV